MASTIAARCSGRSATTAPVAWKTRSPRTASTVWCGAIRATRILDRRARAARDRRHQRARSSGRHRQGTGMAGPCQHRHHAHLRSPAHAARGQPDVQCCLLIAPAHAEHRSPGYLQFKHGSGSGSKGGSKVGVSGDSLHSSRDAGVRCNFVSTHSTGFLHTRGIIIDWVGPDVAISKIVSSEQVLSFPPISMERGRRLQSTMTSSLGWRVWVASFNDVIVTVLLFLVIVHELEIKSVGPNKDTFNVFNTSILFGIHVTINLNLVPSLSTSRRGYNPFFVSRRQVFISAVATACCWLRTATLEKGPRLSPITSFAKATQVSSSARALPMPSALRTIAADIFSRIDFPIGRSSPREDGADLSSGFDARASGIDPKQEGERSCRASGVTFITSDRKRSLL
jgi:hypothetical protein